MNYFISIQTETQRIFFSVKEGKFFGPQITWNCDGTIQKYENIEETIKNCDHVWVEFDYREKFKDPY